MKKKKVLLGAAAATSIGALLVGGTLAYFTASDNTSDVVVSGNIQISLDDQLAKENDGKIENVMPNQKIADKVAVENSGSNDAYVRIKVDTSKSDISTADVLSTFKSTGYSSEKESFASQEDANARVAELAEQGITATVEITGSSEVESTKKRSFVSGEFNYIYVIETMNNEDTWVEKKLKANTQYASYEYNGVKYQLYQTKKMEVASDNVSYTLAEDGFWYRNETVSTLAYEVSYSVANLTDGVNTEDWSYVEENGQAYYYYNEVLEAGENVEFISELKIPKTWGNEYMNKSIQLDITAEAIQVDYLEDEEGNAITNAKDAFAAVTFEQDAE